MRDISGFTFEEYLTIFNALIYGHITSHFFTNWASWIQNRERIKVDMRHLLFTIFVFVMIVNNWWVTYGRTSLVVDRQALFFISLFVPINLFILSTNLFPKLETDQVNLYDYFHKRERRIYSFLLFHFVLNFLVSLVTQEVYFLHQENIFRIMAILLCIIAIALNAKVLNNTFLIIGFVLLGVHTASQGDPPDSEGFSFIEYITIYSTFFFGYVAYLFLTGWAYIVQHIQKIQFGKEYFLWTLLGFGLLIDIWWGAWEREPYSASHLGYFLLSLTTPIVFYMLATVMFPVMKRFDTLDLRSYFRRNEKIIYGLFALIFITNSAVAITMEENSLLNGENIFRAIAILLASFNLMSNSIVVHRIVLGAGWFVFILHIVLY